MATVLALCRKYDPELFFPVGESGPAILQGEQAKAICRACPLIDECLQWALAQGIDFGVWGGYTEQERRILVRRGIFKLGRVNVDPPLDVAMAS